VISLNIQWYCLNYLAIMQGKKLKANLMKVELFSCIILEWMHDGMFSKLTVLDCCYLTASC